MAASCLFELARGYPDVAPESVLSAWATSAVASAEPRGSAARDRLICGMGAQRSQQGQLAGI